MFASFMDQTVHFCILSEFGLRCASKGDPYIQGKDAIQQYRRHAHGSVELLSIQFIAQFCDVGSRFAYGLTVACVLKINFTHQT